MEWEYTYYTDSADEKVDIRRHPVGNEIGGHTDDGNETGHLQASGDNEGHAKGAELRGGHIDNGWLVRPVLEVVVLGWCT